MDFVTDIYYILNIFFTGIGIFLGLYIGSIGIKQKSAFNIAIAISLLSFSIDFIISFLQVSVSFGIYSLGILCIYMYSYNLIHHKKNWQFILSVLLGFSALIILLVLPPVDISDIYRVLAINLSIIVHIYLLVQSIFNLKGYKNQVRNYYSSIKQKELKGLQIIVILFMIFSSFWLIDDLLFFMIGSDVLSNIIFIISFIYSCFVILYLGIYALNNQLHLTELSSTAKELKEVNFIKKSPEPSIEDEALFFRLKELIKEKKLFLNPELSLQDLSSELNTKSKILSKTINHFSGTSFYIFINNYRISYFQELIQEGKDKQMSIDGLIKICGFKSKTTFYTYFKKETGLTPNQFKTKQKKVLVF